MKVKEYFASRGLGYYLVLPAIILSVLAMVFYKQNGINMYSSAYRPSVFVCCGLAIFFAALSLCVDRIPVSFAEELVRPARAISFLLLLYAILQYALTQVMFIGAVAVAIDVDQYGPLVPGFVATVVCLGGAAVFALLSVCLDRVCPWAKSKEKE